MKHILNNLTEEEKNSIREQHTGGIELKNEKFKQLIETKLGNPKPYLSEQVSPTPQIPQEVVDCFKENLGVSDILKFPNCVKMGVDMMTGKMPSQETIQACATDMGKNPSEVGNKILSIGLCVLGKLGKMGKTPVAY